MRDEEIKTNDNSVDQNTVIIWVILKASDGLGQNSSGLYHSSR